MKLRYPTDLGLAEIEEPQASLSHLSMRFDIREFFHFPLPQILPDRQTSKLNIPVLIFEMKLLQISSK